VNSLRKEKIVSLDEDDLFVIGQNHDLQSVKHKLRVLNLLCLRTHTIIALPFLDGALALQIVILCSSDGLRNLVWF
jgi:hypothetical protein